jgi:hypothetical protein
MINSQVINTNTLNYFDYINCFWYTYLGIPNAIASLGPVTCSCNKNANKKCTFSQALNTKSMPCAWIRRNDLINNFAMLTLWKNNILTRSSYAVNI